MFNTLRHEDIHASHEHLGNVIETTVMESILFWQPPHHPNLIWSPLHCHMMIILSCLILCTFWVLQIYTRFFLKILCNITQHTDRHTIPCSELSPLTAVWPQWFHGIWKEEEGCRYPNVAKGCQKFPKVARSFFYQARARSARAFTGRRCPHSGKGEDFLTGQQNFLRKQL